MFNSLALPYVLVIFLAAAVAVWIAGIKLSNTTDVLSTRLGLGEALGGLILLSVATNLPEIAITATAALAHNLEIAVGNLLGGIAIQTVVLALLDAGQPRRNKPLTHQAASLVLVIEGAVVIALLVVVVMGTLLPSSLIAFRVTPASVAITLMWLLGLWLVGRTGAGLPWHASGQAPGGQERPRGHSKERKEERASRSGVSTTRAAVVFGAAAAVTLLGGIVLEQAGQGIARHVGMSGVIFGATFLAGATALPEVSTGLTSVRMRDYQLAVSDIFGGNAFLPVLFLLAVVLSGKAVLPAAHDTDVYLTGLGGLLTVIYILGLIFRPTRRILRMGPDSLTVVFVYVLGMVGLSVVA